MTNTSDESASRIGLIGGPVQHCDRFSDAAEDVVNARIYEGIHFRFADTVAQPGDEERSEAASHTRAAAGGCSSSPI
jgi:hypothetical protein